jgi:hypothetical protein
MTSANALTLSIAGVRFRIRADVEVAEEAPRYAPFLGDPPEDPAPIEVDVALSIAAPPARVAAVPAFDTGETWAFWRDGAVLRLEFFAGRPAREPLWVALVEPDLSHVELYCGAALVDGGRVENPLRYPLDQLLLGRLLGLHGGTLVHAAGVRTGNRGIVMPGQSGAGKSTSMRLLRKAEPVERMSDDRIALRPRGNSFALYGTPWAGDEQVAVNGSAAVVACAFLVHASEDRLVALDSRAALRRLLPTASLIGWDGDLFDPALGACHSFVRSVPCYELRFRRDGDITGLVGELLEGRPCV